MRVDRVDRHRVDIHSTTHVPGLIANRFTNSVSSHDMGRNKICHNVQCQGQPLSLWKHLLYTDLPNGIYFNGNSLMELNGNFIGVLPLFLTYKLSELT